MANSTSGSPGGQFLMGLAWTLIIVMGWAFLRLSLWLVGALTGGEQAFFGIAPPLSYVLVVAHVGIVGFTIYAAMALLRRKAWAQRYVGGVLLLLAVEAWVGGVFLMVRVPEAAEAAAEIQGVKIAAGVAVILVGCTAMVVGWKLLRMR